MMNLKGSKTEGNLLAAFAGESQARNRYTYFASAAKKEGYVQISMAFEETATQEKEHAKRFFKFLEGGDLTITATFPAGVVADTKANLKASADGEKHEWGSMYPDFARIARAEGFEPVAKAFESIAVAERQHEKRYRGFLKNLEEGKAFKKDKQTVWRCINCGYTHEGDAAPENCLACAHPKAYFEVLAENW
ncbi:MAG: rubrerythrin [Elusimicrobia bacterium GWA2_61_42]|nr:MAG: rubrerythrin [Elusimicrobia bacterium GWA2_61_42]OGR77782.1 MAG: rubrerythrin [Elusimicrobia bacterium GWC2_61_25]